MNEKVIATWVKRNNLRINGVIFIIGVVLIVIACVISHSSSSESDKAVSVLSKSSYNAYNILLGLGCSIVAASIITFILSALVIDELSILKEWGLLDVHDSLNNFPGDLPNQTLEIIALGLNDFNINKYKGNLNEKMEKGLQVKIITLNPASSYINIGIQNYRDIGKDIKELIEWVVEFNSTFVSKIELKLCNILPMLYYRNDKKIYKYSSIPYDNARSCRVFQYNVATTGGKHYEEIFDDMWTTKSISYRSKVDTWYGNQENGIKQVLNFFCGMLNPVEKIEGVVVLFKDNQRRTFYSCNKSKEANRVKGKDEGAVGELIKYNENSEKKAVILKTYLETKKIFLYSPRTKKMKTEYSDVEKMKSHDDMTAMFATPLFYNDDLIGAVTFEFTSLPLALNGITKDNTESDEVYKIFDNVYSCGNIIEELLGKSIITHEFNKLFNETWEDKNV